LPSPEDPAYHRDGLAYRLAAIRETFEESGILLAKKIGRGRDAGLLHVPDEVREAGRRLVHSSKVKFTDWLKEQGGEPDVGTEPFMRES
jgi:8-oxo-dGTP pyrophosphatase MutT (NUDIX family)